jgi:hypothetical protein
LIAISESRRPLPKSVHHPANAGSHECEYTKDENRRLSNECQKWKRIAIPAVVIVIVGLVGASSTETNLISGP